MKLCSLSPRSTRRSGQAIFAVLFGLLSACSGSDDDELSNADAGRYGRIDAGGAGKDAGSLDDRDAGGQGSMDGGGDGDGDGDGNTHSDAGSLTAHPKSCEPAVLAGDGVAAINEDFPRITRGPGSKALISWAAPQQYWHVRTYDGAGTFGPVHHLFDNYASGNILPSVRAVVGHGHALFNAQIPDSTHYLRRYDEASDTWSDAVAQTGQTLALAVRPNGTFLRVVGGGFTATLETIDATSGNAQSQPLKSFSSFIGQYHPIAFTVDGVDQGALVLGVGADLHAFVLRAGQVVGDTTLVSGELPYAVEVIQQSSGDAVIVWQDSTSIRVSRLSYDLGNDTASLSSPEFIYQGAGGDMVAAGTPDGEITVAWANANTYARRFVGGAWGDVVTLYNRIGNPSAIAISDSGMVAFMLDPNTGSDAALSTVLKGQQTWSTIDIPVKDAYRPSLAFNAAGEPYFIWAAAARDMSGRREIMLTTCR